MAAFLTLTSIAMASGDGPGNSINSDKTDGAAAGSAAIAKLGSLAGQELLVIKDISTWDAYNFNKQGCRLDFEAPSRGEIFLKAGTVLAIDSAGTSVDGSFNGVDPLINIGKTGSSIIVTHTKYEVNEMDGKGDRKVSVVLECQTDSHIFGLFARLANKNSTEVLSSFSDTLKLIAKDAGPLPLPTGSLRPCMSLDLSHISEQTKCLSDKGVAFELLKRDGRGDEVWKDLKTNVIWSDLMHQEHSIEERAEICQSDKSDAVDARAGLSGTHFILPSNQDYETAEKDGFRSVLSMVSLSGLGTSTKPAPGQIYQGDPKNNVVSYSFDWNQGKIIQKDTFRSGPGDYLQVRCVSKGL